MKARFRPAEALRGSVIALVAAVLSFGFARLGFGRDYYLAILLPVAMFLCLLVAWGLYLKDDGYIRKAAIGKPIDGTVPVQGDADGVLGGITGGASIFAPRDDTVLSRAPIRPGSRYPAGTDDADSREGGSGSTRRALVCAAAELALLATALYLFAGIGAGFYG